ncbi:MAG: hypothetical protein KIT16_05585 [Rhodospirillaceae bacterium]|nr:hypothetical protein [Rhodospirillaceae bacterium]
MTERNPGDTAGLSQDQETALVAIGQAMDAMKAHGDALSQWRLLQIEAAIAALDRGRHDEALRHVERASQPADSLTPEERRDADALAHRLDLDRLRATLRQRWPGRG